MHRAVPLPLYLIAWLPFAVLYAIAVRLSGAGSVDSVLSGLTSVGAAALLGLGAVQLAPPWSSRRISWRWLVHHTVLGSIYAALWTAVIAAQIVWNAPRAILDGFLANAIRWQFVSGLILYALLMAVFTVADTVSRLRVEQQRATRAEAQRVRAELQALRAQLNPHFLFNTLHSITALVRTDPHRAEAALEHLAACLRHILDTDAQGRDELPLGDELAFVRDYLALERLRHGERLRVIEEIDPDALDEPVLAFLLQPLVENAIRHGMAPLTRPVTIRIEARLGGEHLVLAVADDGAGSAAVSREGGIGLRAVQQRLATRYGPGAQLTVETAPGAGCRVTMTMPSTPRVPAERA